MSVDPTDPALVAAVDEALNKPPTTLDWQGVTVPVVAEVEDLDPDVLEAFENGKSITAVRSLFGSDEYDRARKEFEKLHGRRPTMRDITALSDAIAAHFGFESAGN